MSYDSALNPSKGVLERVPAIFGYTICLMIVGFIVALAGIEVSYIAETQDNPPTNMPGVDYFAFSLSAAVFSMVLALFLFGYLLAYTIVNGRGQ